jgi:hypothetical protein
MKTPKQMWLVYTPGERDERSEEPRLICPDEATANACKNKINEFIERLVDRLPDLHENDVDEWQKKWDKRKAILAKVRWPYGVKFDDYEICRYGDVVQVKPVPFRGAA